MSYQAIFIIASWLTLVETCSVIEVNGREAVIQTLQDSHETRKKGPLLDADKLDYDVHKVGKGMKIEAKGLCFRYPGQKSNTLKDVDLIIEPGESLAIVGYNGSGMSTEILIPKATDRLVRLH